MYNIAALKMLRLRPSFFPVVGGVGVVLVARGFVRRRGAVRRGDEGFDLPHEGGAVVGEGLLDAEGAEVVAAVAHARPEVAERREPPVVRGAAVGAAVD